MKVLGCLAAALLTAGGLSAQAQYAAYPFGYDHASTIAEGYGRGLGDVIRAKGEYNLNSSAAALNLSEARLREIENRKLWVQAYFDIRNINKQVFDAEQKQHRGTREDWNRFAQMGKPKRLGPSQLDSVTGEIQWPILLTAQQYSGFRVDVEKAFADRAYHGLMAAEVFLKVSQLIEDMLAGLKAQISRVPADQYVVAKRFLESLAYEAGQPAG